MHFLTSFLVSGSKVDFWSFIKVVVGIFQVDDPGISRPVACYRPWFTHLRSKQPLKRVYLLNGDDSELTGISGTQIRLSCRPKPVYSYRLFAHVYRSLQIIQANLNLRVKRHITINRDSKEEIAKFRIGRGHCAEDNSNSKTLFYKDCSLGLVKNLSNN